MCVYCLWSDDIICRMKHYLNLTNHHPPPRLHRFDPALRAWLTPHWHLITPTHTHLPLYTHFEVMASFSADNAVYAAPSLPSPTGQTHALTHIYTHAHAHTLCVCGCSRWLAASSTTFWGQPMARRQDPPASNHWADWCLWDLGSTNETVARVTGVVNGGR